VEFYVHPMMPDGERERLSLALAEAAVAHAGSRPRHGTPERGAAPAVLKAGLPRDDLPAAAGLKSVGFGYDRTFWEMALALDPAADAGPAPDGVRVRRLHGGEAGWRLVHALVEQAFAEHWGHRQRSFELWWTHQNAVVAPVPELSWVAELDGEPVAMCLTDDSRAASGGGYVRTLGVLEPARGRGIARHLLRTAFTAHAARGWSWTALRVDSTNPTGATALYSSVGMAAVDVFDVYARAVGGPA
jgi:ribosomal protein S18 acetylase RimI-like enzyme